MTLNGWSLPLTASGKVAILTPPPWHYSGDIIAVDFTADPTTVQSLLPKGLLATATGAASVVFADWCSASDHDARVQADPAVGQYREAYVVLHATASDKRVGRVPFIWVDREISFLRGHVQGFPKKLGEIHMTKPVTIGRGGSIKADGSRFAAHTSAKGRRLITAAVTLTGTTDRVPPCAALPLVHTRLFPSIDRPEPAVHELQRGKIEGFSVGIVHTGDATLEFGFSDFEEILELGPVSVGQGYVFEMAFSVTGGTVEQIEASPGTSTPLGAP
jgi:acetoacetate decarboxylase